jgi:predicted amidophosphoribosyltransferase
VPYDAGEPLLSAAAIAKPPVYERPRAAARCSATMRELIQSFKYRDRHEGLPLFGLWLKKAALQPLGDARAQRTGSPVPVDSFVLSRVRLTQSQVQLSADQRRRNVAGGRLLTLE